MSHPFVERLIGSVRRELLDQAFFWTATDLENKLRNYQCYYNEHRCHSSRDGVTPVSKARGMGIRQGKGLIKNADGSYDVYFGPKAPKGQENNWVQTIPGKGWNTIFRLYGPLEPRFEKTWRPGEIELMK